MRGLEDHVAGSLLQPVQTRFGSSQTAFADPFGFARTSLSAHEPGRRRPTLPTRLRLPARAGLELRIELTELDHHGAVLAECTLDEPPREQRRTQLYRLASDAA